RLRGRAAKERPGPSLAHVTISAAAILPALALGGCGAPTRPLAAERPAIDAAAASSDEWASASWEQRHDTMTWLVLPNLARKFQEFEGTQFPQLACVTCHGADAEQVSYKMPNGLPPLDPAHLPSETSANPREARFAAFMQNDVT